MKYVFFGTPLFAAIVLKRLLDEGFVPAALVCNPDRPFGRKKIITPPPTKKLVSGVKNHISILQPETAEELKSGVINLKAEIDFFVVSAYARILPKEVISLPRLGVIGAHPSLLPKYRGATPIQSAILGGDEYTGTTIFIVDEKMDHGPIVSKVRYQVQNTDNYEFLLNKLAGISGNLLVETLPKLLLGEISPVPQDESRATYTTKFTTEDAFVNYVQLKNAEEDGEEATEIWRKIRALNPEPGAFTIDENDKRIKLLEAEIVSEKLVLKKIQKDGKAPQDI